MNIKSVLTITSAAFLLTSCLKSSDPFGWDGDGGSVVIEIEDAAAFGPEKILALEASPPTETVDAVTIKYHAPRSAKPGSDIQVTLVQNDAAVTAAGYTLMPANAYSIGSLTVTIPKGSTDGEVALPITINKANLDLSQVYGIAFDIASVSEGVISDLARHVVVVIIVKNEFDADYDVTGYFFHPSAGRALGLTKHMGTVGATRVEGQVGDLGGFNFRVDVVGTTVSNWAASGATPPVPASGLMTLDNPGGVSHAPLSVGPPFVHANYPNNYNPATKTFLLHYGYHSGGNGQNTFTRQIYEKWVRH